MKYHIHIQSISGENYTNEIISAACAAEAHTFAAKLIGNNIDDVEKISVYPVTYNDDGTMDENGLAVGALMIARRTARNAIVNNGGNSTQWRIDRELSAANAKWSELCGKIESELAREGLMLTVNAAEHINAIIAEKCHDVQDFYGYAMTGLVAYHGHAISDQYNNGYRELNRYIHAQRAATNYELSTEFVIDGGGDIVAIGTAIAQIIKSGDRYTPTPSPRLDEKSAVKLCGVLHAAIAGLTPTQKAIVDYLGEGYTYRQIADITGRELSTIAEHVANIRTRCTDYISRNAPEFVDNKAVQTSIKSEDVKAAKTANKGKSAEYYRAYRAKKRAEKAAKKAAEQAAQRAPFEKAYKAAKKGSAELKTLVGARDRYEKDRFVAAAISKAEFEKAYKAQREKAAKTANK